MNKKTSITIDGVSLNADFHEGKSEADFVNEEKHNFGGDTSRTKDAFRRFNEQLVAQRATETKEKETSDNAEKARVEAQKKLDAREKKNPTETETVIPENQGGTPVMTERGSTIK